MCGRRREYVSKEELRRAKNESSRNSHRIARHIKWQDKHPEPLRTTLNPPPTIEQLAVAFERREDSVEAMIRLGSLLEDAEASFGVGYQREPDGLGGTWVDWDSPWQSGIRGWLRQSPPLLAKYKTLMRYKKLSAEFRKVIGLADPTPASWVWDHPKDIHIAQNVLPDLSVDTSFRSFHKLLHTKSFGGSYLYSSASKRSSRHLSVLNNTPGRGSGSG